MPEVDKSAVKKKIQELITRYESDKAANRLRTYTEQDTKRVFIEPLFEALGWDVRDRSEVSTEESQSGGRVDYGFYHNDRIAFYLEAKKLTADLMREEFADQAVRYAWNKAATWAVLTDFEGIKVFNAQDIKRSLADKILLDIRYTEYLERFDELWLLSKESFEQDLLDKEAVRRKKKYDKVPVTDTLYKDLNECRNLLTKSLSKCNPGLDADLLDEGVQKLLDRLIFLRVAEDREVEPNILKQLLREAQTNRTGTTTLYEAMSAKFRELDATYNSNLFSEHPFEKWDEYDGGTEKAIQLLYGKKGYYEYDFKAMPADVLGTVYEHYLAHRLSKSKKGVTLDKDATKRKEQGIYYTPSFVVDYIVRHALGPVLDKCKTMDQLLKIKVLDPACGSGSFLIKALEVLNEKYKQIGAPDDEWTRLTILTQNLYGVDLDEKAVEIARLNLLINSLEGKQKLPVLANNIKCGNSLISGENEELKKYFGKNYHDKKSFNWKEEFPSVFEQGGFDVVIGNPPYVSSRELDQSDKGYFEHNYGSAKDQYDLYALFVERGVGLMKTDGRLGFIVPNKFLITKYGLELRKFIFENASVENFKDYSKDNIFPDASVYPIVIILRKGSDKSIVTTNDYDLLKEFGFGEADSVVAKLESIKRRIDLEAWRPLATAKNIIAGNNIVISNREINRYSFAIDRLGDLNLKRDYDVVKNKIIMKKLCYFLEASFDEIGFYPINTTYCIKFNSDKNEIAGLKYVLAILNSKLLSYYVRKKYAETALRGGFIELRVFQIEKLPILSAALPEQKEIAVLSDQMLRLHKKISVTEENSNEWTRLKSEIEKTDRKIDDTIYKLYDLTAEEIDIIEKNHRRA